MAVASNTHPCGITGVHYEKKFLEDVEGSAPKLAGMLGLADSSMVWKSSPFTPSPIKSKHNADPI